MANKRMFNTQNAGLPQADTLNEAGGIAYSLPPKQALAQLACTGTFNQTYYTSDEEQLNKLRTILNDIPVEDYEFVAKTAVYARTKGFMKDMPAFLLAWLAVQKEKEAHNLVSRIFNSIIDNGRMLRNLVQMLRSGVFGRCTIPRPVRHLISTWLHRQSGDWLFRDSIGNDPSIADIIKMVHPCPHNSYEEAMFGYLIGKQCAEDKLPNSVLAYERWKKDPKSPIPKGVDFRMLTGLDLDDKQKKRIWSSFAETASWTQTRMNLNNFSKYGVLEDKQLKEKIANRLRNKTLIAQANCFPYQILMAYEAASDLDSSLSSALHDAMEEATINVPEMTGNLAVCPDVSGSMGSPITGHRKGSTTDVQCVTVAALFAASICRKNPGARVLPFNGDVVPCRIEPRDTVMTNAMKLAELLHNGTDCSAPLRKLNEEKAKVDAVLLFSDEESWMDSEGKSIAGSRYGGLTWSGYYNAASVTKTMSEWKKLKRRNKNAKLVCVDLQPITTSQVINRDDILSIGGFSDNIFEVIAAFLEGDSKNHWVDVIEGIEI